MSGRRRRSSGRRGGRRAAGEIKAGGGAAGAGGGAAAAAGTERERERARAEAAPQPAGRTDEGERRAPRCPCSPRAAPATAHLTARGGEESTEFAPERGEVSREAPLPEKEDQQAAAREVSAPAWGRGRGGVRGPGLRGALSSRGRGVCVGGEVHPHLFRYFASVE